MRMHSFAIRNTKEIIRDPLTVGFSLGFPLVLLALLSAIQANIPVSLFEIERLAPGITVFGLSFMTLFSATLVARDRETALIERLYTTPMRSFDFILGYMLPIIPIAVAQAAISYLFALILGLTPSLNVIYSILFVIPVSLFFVSMGLLFGSILNVKQVGGICGALFTNLAAWLSGIWFDVELVGGAFLRIAECLPFIHAVRLQRIIISAGTGGSSVAEDILSALPHLGIVLAYAMVSGTAAVLLFLRGMKKR